MVASLFAIPISFMSLKKERNMFDGEKWKYLFKMALPMLPHYLALSIMAGGDKIAIAHIMGDGAIGKYSVAYSVGFIISLITSGISLAVSPWLIRHLGNRNNKEISSKLSSITRAVTLLTLLFLAAAKGWQRH